MVHKLNSTGLNAAVKWRYYDIATLYLDTNLETILESHFFPLLFKPEWKWKYMLKTGRIIAMTIKEHAKIPRFSKQVRQNSIVLPSLWNLKSMLHTQHTMIQNSWPILKEIPEKVLLTIAN